MPMVEGRREARGKAPAGEAYVLGTFPRASNGRAPSDTPGEPQPVLS